MLPYLRGKVNTNGAVEDDFFLWAVRMVSDISRRGLPEVFSFLFNKNMGKILLLQYDLYKFLKQRKESLTFIPYYGIFVSIITY